MPGNSSAVYMLQRFLLVKETSILSMGSGACCGALAAFALAGFSAQRWLGLSGGIASYPQDASDSAGLVDVKVCAVDGTWSGLKFVYRLKDR